MFLLNVSHLVSATAKPEIVLAIASLWFGQITKPASSVFGLGITLLKAYQSSPKCHVDKNSYIVLLSAS